MSFGWTLTRRRQIVAAVIVGFVAALQLLWTRAPDEGSLRVQVFDVGQGDGILVTLPTGDRWLVDGGPDRSILSALDGEMLPWDRRLAGVVLTHPHADHVAGLVEVLRLYDVGTIVMPTVVHTTPEYAAFLEEIRQQAIPVIAADHPFAWSGAVNGRSWEWAFLYPSQGLPDTMSDLNDASVVSRITYGDQRVLLMGDAGAETESVLLAQRRDLQSTLVKIGHHGSDTSTTAAFVEAVAPQVAVISVGEGNRYGHPSESVVRRLADAGVRVLRTDLSGSVDFRTTPDGYEVGEANTGESLAKRLFSGIVNVVVGTTLQARYLFSITSFPTVLA